MDHTPKTCAICGISRDMFPLEAVIALTRWPVCTLCARAGAALRAEGVLAPSLHCLKLTAMELEAFAEGYASEPNDWPAQRWRDRIKRNLARPEWRATCPCPTCTGTGDHVVMTDIFGLFDIDPGTFADTMPLQVLKSMKPGQRVQASDGSTWKAVDEIARRLEMQAIETRRGMVGPLARAATPTGPGEWADPDWDLPQGKRQSGHYTYQPIDENKRRKRDEETKRYWRGFALYGRGYLDGWIWVTDDGQRHDLRKVQS